MRYESNQERRVRRRLNEYYGSHEVDTIQYTGDNEYWARLLDGSLVVVTVMGDGTLRVKENPPWGC